MPTMLSRIGGEVDVPEGDALATQAFPLTADHEQAELVHAANRDALAPTAFAFRWAIDLTVKGIGRFPAGEYDEVTQTYVIDRERPGELVMGPEYTATGWPYDSRTSGDPGCDSGVDHIQDWDFEIGE
jgi:hypothetical protein